MTFGLTQVGVFIIRIQSVDVVTMVLHVYVCMRLYLDPHFQKFEQSCPGTVLVSLSALLHTNHLLYSGIGVQV